MYKEINRNNPIIYRHLRELLNKLVITSVGIPRNSMHSKENMRASIKFIV